MGRYDVAWMGYGYVVLDTRNRYMKVAVFDTRGEALAWIKLAEGR